MDEPRYCYRHPDRETGLSCSECGRPICYECMTPAPVGLRCPEHAGKQRVIRPARRPAGAVRFARGAAAVTYALIGINVGVYLAELAIGGTFDGQNNWIYEHGALFASGVFAFGQPIMGVAHGEWWRLVTAAFLHYGPIHLGLNMLALYFGGTVLEQVIGHWRFALLYVASGIAGSAGALIVTPNSPTVGASGAIFGVFGALFALERRGIIQSNGQILALIVINLVFTFAVPGISIGGHVGGLIAGFVLMYAMTHFARSVELSILAATAVVIVSVVVAYSQVRGYS
ncbi:MAG TPA: rhomboid family intramembrane serine protease [Gaiellaceae bacterium]